MDWWWPQRPRLRLRWPTRGGAQNAGPNGAAKDKRNPEQQMKLGADTQYQEEKFIEDLRQRSAPPPPPPVRRMCDMGSTWARTV